MRLTLSLALGVIAPFGVANELDMYVGVEGRYFWQEPVFPDQSEHNFSITANADYYHDFDEDNQRVAFTAYGRIDSEDSERSHFDFRELYWWKNFGAMEMYVGLRKIFWGVTESAHIVDVINQTDNLENVDGEDKLGQPMIELVSAQDWGTISAYIMPYFREQEFVGPESRLRFGVPVLEDAVYQSSSEEEHVDLALRWSHYIGIWDFGLSHFSGTSRRPIFTPDFSTGELSLIANYQQIEQSGLDLQATVDAWLFKVETASIYEQDFGRNTAFAGGVEYTFFTIGGTNADLGIVAEYQFDDRRGIRETLTQNDVVLGARWAFNDIDGSEVLVLASHDIDYKNRFFSVEVSRRLNDQWKLEAEARIFSNVKEESPAFAFRDDDYIQVELRRFF